MTKFLLKGLLRDRNRSLFPFIIVSLGVMITTLNYCFVLGMQDEMIRDNARLDTGHVKIFTQGYRDISSQIPNDLAIANIDEFMEKLERDFPEMEWAARIKFGGLLDIPDENGETRSQGPAFGLAMDLIGSDSKEKTRLNFERALVRGRLPESSGEMVISDEFAEQLGIKIGETATLISSTASGGMAIHNFTVVGTVRFGISALDRNAVFADLSDIQYALDMEGSASEVLGFFPNLIFNEKAAAKISQRFNSSITSAGLPEDEFTPLMLTLRDQGGLGEYLDTMNLRIFIIIGTFVLTMSLVLWNAGLRSGIRRYGEMGVRLAMGEAKGHVYSTLLYEAILVGIVGSFVGTAAGLGISYYLQEVGWDMSNLMQGSNILMANVMRAKITTTSYFVGFVPGLLATVIGTAFSGIQVFKRQTAQLFKELET